MPTARQSGRSGDYVVELSELNISLKLNEVAKNYFSTHSKRDEFHINWTVLKALAHTGDLYSDTLHGRTLIDELPALNPKRCRMSDSELQLLLGRLQGSMMAHGVTKAVFELLSGFLRYETPLHEIDWREEYSRL